MKKYLLLIIVGISVYASASSSQETLYNRGTVWMGHPIPDDALVLKGISKHGSFKQTNIASFKDQEKDSSGQEVTFLLSIKNLTLSASPAKGLIRKVLGTFLFCFQQKGAFPIIFCSPQSLLGTYNAFTGVYMLKNVATKNWTLNLSPNDNVN